MKTTIKTILSALVLSLAFTNAPVNAQPLKASSIKTDPTRGISKAERPTVSFEVWITSPTALRVIKKESRGNCKAVGAKGKYRGKWQMNAGFWKTYGGLEFAPRADLATCEQQDQVAYRGWLARGWQPWGIKS